MTNSPEQIGGSERTKPTIGKFTMPDGAEKLLEVYSETGYNPAVLWKLASESTIPGISQVSANLLTSTNFIADRGGGYGMHYLFSKEERNNSLAVDNERASLETFRQRIENESAGLAINLGRAAVSRLVEVPVDLLAIPEWVAGNSDRNVGILARRHQGNLMLLMRGLMGVDNISGNLKNELFEEYTNAYFGYSASRRERSLEMLIDPKISIGYKLDVLEDLTEISDEIIEASVRSETGDDYVLTNGLGRLAEELATNSSRTQGDVDLIEKVIEYIESKKVSGRYYVSSEHVLTIANCVMDCDLRFDFMMNNLFRHPELRRPCKMVSHSDHAGVVWFLDEAKVRYEKREISGEMFESTQKRCEKLISDAKQRSKKKAKIEMLLLDLGTDGLYFPG